MNISILQKPQTAVFIILLMTVLLPVSGVHAQSGTQYMWVITSQQEGIYDRGQQVETRDNDYSGDNTWEIDILIGRWIRQPNSNWFTCGAYICAFGKYVLTKNTNLTFADGSGGLRFSNAVNIERYDSRPMVAFGWSSAAVSASIAGFLDEPLVKGAAIALIAMIISRKVIEGIREVLKVGQNHFNREEEEGQVKEENPQDFTLDRTEEGRE